MAIYTKDLTTELAELEENVKTQTSTYASNTPAIIFSAKETALQVTAGRIYVLISNTLQELKEIVMLISDKDYKDSVNIGIIKYLEKLREFYEEIAANKGVMKKSTEFSNKRILEPFETLLKRAEQLTQMYAGVE